MAVGFLALLPFDSTPEATLDAVIASLNSKDWRGVVIHFDGAKVDKAVKMLTEATQSEKSWPKFALKITNSKVDGDTASLSVTESIQMGTGSPTSMDDVVKLTRKQNDWLIQEGKGTTSLFTQIGSLARSSEVELNKAKQAAQSTVVLSNMKQIALGVLMHANDNDDKILLTQANLKQKLAPYLKSTLIWTGPDKKPLDVRLNGYLTGKSMTQIAEPANCVMLTVGPKDKFVYFNGKTPVAFVDGHVKYMTSDQASKLKWK